MLQSRRLADSVSVKRLKASAVENSNSLGSPDMSQPDKARKKVSHPALTLSDTSLNPASLRHAMCLGSISQPHLHQSQLLLFEYCALTMDATSLHRDATLPPVRRPQRGLFRDEGKKATVDEGHCGQLESRPTYFAALARTRSGLSACPSCKGTHWPRQSVPRVSG